MHNGHWRRTTTIWASNITSASKASKALEALQKAYEYAHNIGAKELICDYYEYSSWVYAAIGDYDQAYKRLSQMYALSKELQSSNKLRNIEQEISYKRYQDQKYATEMQEQTYKIELLKRNLWLLGSILILGLAFSIFLYKWYKRQKRSSTNRSPISTGTVTTGNIRIETAPTGIGTAKCTECLRQQSKEVTSFAVFLRSRNELLGKIREMIKEGYRMDNQALVPHLKKVNAFIGNGSC